MGVCVWTQGSERWVLARQQTWASSEGGLGRGLGGTAPLATLMPTSLKSHIPKPQSHPTLCSFLCPPPTMPEASTPQFVLYFHGVGRGKCLQGPSTLTGPQVHCAKNWGGSARSEERRVGCWGGSLNFQGAENFWWAGSQNLILPCGKGNPAEGRLGIRLGRGDMDGYMIP